MGIFDSFTGNGLLGFAGGLGSGLLGMFGSKSANEKNNANSLLNWQLNYNAQKEFAQNGIRWKVDDAKNSGIHPLFGLGANGASYTPINTQSYYENEYAGLANSLNSMSQDISRAKMAKKTPAEQAIEEAQEQQLYDLNVKQKEADIALTQAQTSEVLRRSQQLPPPMPSVTGRQGLIEGQGDTIDKGQYGVLNDILKGTQFYEAPNGGYMIAPHQQLMDLISEGIIQKSQFYNMIDDAYRNGSLKLPRKPDKGYSWQVDLATGTFKQVPTDQVRTGLFNLFRKNSYPVSYENYYRW